MGGGNWTDDGYRSYARSTGYAKKETTTREVFQNNSITAALDPRKALLRESCDSEDNPDSTPIILALDLTGSMGEYATLIAKEALPEVMTSIITNKPITDPHVMFMGISDIHTYAKRDSFQVSQFEADIRILQQLRELFIAGGGGSNYSESYDLPWYFAGTRTKLDSMVKRGKKGFLFTMGDERAPYELVRGQDLDLVLGGQHRDIHPSESLKLAQESYHVFHITIEQGSGFSGSESRNVRRTWDDMLGVNALYLQDFKLLPELITTTLRVASGSQTLEQALEQVSNRKAMEHAFVNALNGMQ